MNSSLQPAWYIEARAPKSTWSATALLVPIYCSFYRVVMLNPSVPNQPSWGSSQSALPRAASRQRKTRGAVMWRKRQSIKYSQFLG